MKRALVVLALVASPVLATTAQACDFEYCPGTKQVCDLHVYECGDGPRENVCDRLVLPPPLTC